MNLKVHNLKYKKLSEEVANCFKDEEDFRAWRDLEVDVEDNGEDLKVKVWQMYEYLPLSFKVMRKLAEVFGTEKYGVNNWSSGGCETCDYGSQYCHEFTFKQE